MSRGALLAWGLAALLLCLLVRAPAALWEAGVAAGGAGLLDLRASQGSFWSGRGDLLLRVDGRWRALGTLAWRREGLGLSLRLDEAGEASVQPASAGWHLKLTRLRLPAWTLAVLPLAAARTDPAGELELASPGWTCPWGGGPCRGEVLLHWRDAALPTVAGGTPLGSHTLRLRAGGAQCSVDGHSDPGPLQALAALQCAHGRLRGTLELWSTAGRGDPLSVLLDGVGTAQPGSGHRQVVIDLPLRGAGT